MAESKPTSQRFPSRFRLQRRLDIAQVKRDGRRRQGALFTLLRLDRSTAHEPSQANRLAVTVSKRIGSAVVRNRWRRRVRDCFRRQIFPEHEVKTSDYLVIVRQPGGPPQTAALAAELARLVQESEKRS